MTPADIQDALCVALSQAWSQSLWLHLVTLCQRLRSALRPILDGYHVYLGELRLTRSGGHWLAYRQEQPGEYHKLKEMALDTLAGELGGAS